MIELYYYTSPNGRKAALALEETGLPYETVWVDITAGDQHQDWFRRINPNGKIPAIVDRDGPNGPLAVFESGAILEYLAAKSGQLLPEDPAERWRARCWVYWQVANQGPMCGQAAHFVSHARERGIRDDYATERYTREAGRCYQVLEQALADREFLAGEYSIADIACFPWTNSALRIPTIGTLDPWPNLVRWRAELNARPAVQRGLAQPKRD